VGPCSAADRCSSEISSEDYRRHAASNDRAFLRRLRMASERLACPRILTRRALDDPLRCAQSLAAAREIRLARFLSGHSWVSPARSFLVVWRTPGPIRRLSICPIVLQDRIRRSAHPAAVAEQADGPSRPAGRSALARLVLNRLGRAVERDGAITAVRLCGPWSARDFEPDAWRAAVSRADSGLLLGCKRRLRRTLVRRTSPQCCRQHLPIRWSAPGSSWPEVNVRPCCGLLGRNFDQPPLHRRYAGLDCRCA